MRAVVIRRFGGPDALEIDEVPIPKPDRGQVRIRVCAAAVNAVDLAARAGFLVAGDVLSRAAIGIGCDVSGLVDAVGEDAGGFSPGDAVIGLRDQPGTSLGTYADYVVLERGAVAAAPKTVSLIESATLPLHGLSALQALDLLEPRPGATVLVTGLANATGGFVATEGYRVVVVGAKADEELAKALGAEIFVSREVAFAEKVLAMVPGGVDAVLDTGFLGPHAVGAVASRGQFVVFASGAAPASVRGIRVVAVSARADGGGLAKLAGLVDDGVLELRAVDVFPLTKVAEAHERFESARPRTQLVLNP
ncbi:NADP-dependent oxidoreductase [Amycolatopsis sp. cmx-11-12]|uniref:NADP-dependent oxidoreductase n=1 Tax=Amycolatopsis sp. cmx-11-12 TaxID=2785795 RepID=UPI003917C581